MKNAALTHTFQSDFSVDLYKLQPLHFWQ